MPEEGEEVTLPLPNGRKVSGAAWRRVVVRFRRRVRFALSAVAGAVEVGGRLVRGRRRVDKGMERVVGD